MSLASDLLPAILSIRGIPGTLGTRPYRVEVHRVTWSGDRTAEGLPGAAMVSLVEGDGQPARVQWLTSEQLALGGYAAGSVRVGPITPYFEVDGVGYGTRRESILASDAASGDQVQYRVIGGQFPAGKVFELKSFDDGSTTAFYLTLEPVGSG